MEHRLVKLFIINNKRLKVGCHTCDGFEKWSWIPKTKAEIEKHRKHKCTKTNVKVADRITFNIDISYNPKEIAAITCVIDKHIVGIDNGSLLLIKFIEKTTQNLNANEEIIKSSIQIINNRKAACIEIKNNDNNQTKTIYKLIGSELYFVPATKPGILVKSYLNSRGDIASSVSFDFIFTTNDTDIDAFEPYIHEFGCVCDNEITKIITNHIMQRKINKNKNNSFYTEDLKNKIAQVKIKQSNAIYSLIEIDPSIKGPMKKHVQKRYVKPIADTLAIAIV